MNDLSQRRSFNRRGAAALEQQITESLDAIATKKTEQAERVRRHVAEQRALRGTVTHEQLVEALNQGLKAHHGFVVRDDSGWHLVLRINAKSVTVPGPWGGKRTIPIERLLEVRA